MSDITVFTPTYNREEKLKILYESLCRQTYKDFVWLIVDDGSTDNTEVIIRDWIKEKRISIQYHKQENGGKMRAHNRGVQLCKTKYFVCVDSDDYLIEDAIEIMESRINEVENDSTKAGLLLRKYLSEEDNIPFNVEGNCTTLYNLYNSGFRGETTLLFKTDILRLYPFPVVDGEKFITENIVYSLIDQKYLYLYVSKAVTICEYNPDGYTLNLLKLYKNNPCGYVNYFLQLAGLYNNEADRQRAYMFTFFIKDKEKCKEYKKKCDFSFKTKLFGYLRFIKLTHGRKRKQ